MIRYRHLAGARALASLCLLEQRWGEYGMHKKGIDAEDRVNGNERKESLPTGKNFFFNKDGSVYEQFVTNQKSGTVKVIKTKIR